MRWLVAFIVVLAVGWGLERLEMPLWAGIVLQTVVVGLVVTAVKMYEGRAVKDQPK
jgi:hypothetical protein